MTYTPIVIGAPNWGPPVNAAFTSQDARITANLDALVFSVKDHGAVGDGITDDAGAINTLINTVTNAGARGTIYFPRGTYAIGSPLLPTVAMRFTGDEGAVIKSSASDVINFNNNYMHPGQGGQVGVIEFDHLILDATGGHVFNNANINQGSFHDLILHARSSDKGIWNHAGNLQVVEFSNIISTVYGATRTFPGWNIVGISTSDVANVTFRHCLFQNNGLDATQYQVLLTATDGTAARRYHQQNAFRDCFFEAPYGGAIKVMSGQGTVLDNCRTYDTFVNTVGNSLFYFGQATPGTWPSTNNIITNCGRDLQGPNGSTTWDIQLESTCLQTTISNYDIRDIPGTFTGQPFLNLGNSANVALTNNRNQSLTNSNVVGLWNFSPDGIPAANSASSPMAPGPIDMGWKAWTFDPVIVSGGATTVVAGTVYLSKVLVRQPISVSNIHLYVKSAGVTLTASQNFAGIYNSAGSLVAQTADQTANWVTANTFRNIALTGGPFTLNPGFYWVSVVSNGTTTPGFGRAVSTEGTALYGGGVTAANYRFATNSTAQTSLPASFTPSANVISAIPIWFALS